MDKSEHRIGLLGGTFDPPHLAHLRIAEESRIAFNLSEIWFIPAGSPPHKRGTFFSFEDRFNMLKVAIKFNPFFKVLDIEKEETPSYTLKTLEKLKKLYSQKEFFLIIGMDAFQEIETWWHYERFLNFCNLIVVSRGAGNWNRAEDFVKDRAEKLWGKEAKKKAFFLEVFPLEISSTLLRTYLKEGRSIRYLVPEEVYFYLKERGFLQV